MAETKIIQTSGNDPLDKKSIHLNGAGAHLDNPIPPSDPILEGLGMSFQVRQHLTDSVPTAFSGLISPATTPIALVQDSVDPLLYRSDFAAGSGPSIGFVGKKAFFRILMIDKGGTAETSIEKQVHIAALPDDAIQVRNTAGAFIEVNVSRFPTQVPVVKQFCEVKLFESWIDEFRIKHYGGSSHVSVYDRADGESGIKNDDVVRQVKVPIDQLNRIVLVRRLFSGAALHQITFRFRSVKDGSLLVDVDVDLITNDCFPKMSRGSEFPDWVVGT